MKTIKEYISTPGGIMQMWDDINGILDNFDFSAVYVAMEALEWKWAMKDDSGFDEERQPEINELQKRAREMLVGLVLRLAEEGENNGFDNCGGFEVAAEVIDDELRKRVFGEDAPDDFKHSVELKLRFIIEENIPKTW